MKVEMAVLGSPSLISLMVSVDVSNLKQHLKKKEKKKKKKERRRKRRRRRNRRRSASASSAFTLR